MLPGDQERQDPAEGGGDGRGDGLHFDREQLGHDRPRQRTQTPAVSHYEEYQRQDRQPTNAGHHRTTLLSQNEEHA